MVSESHPSCGIISDLDGGQFYHCFSCGSSGTLPWLLFSSKPDDFKTFNQAIEFFSNRYGCDFTLNKHISEILRYEDMFSKNEVHRVVLPMYKLAPFKSGKVTYQYFLDRGFDLDDVRYYMIGRDSSKKTITIPVFDREGNLGGIIGRYISKSRPKNYRYEIYDGFKKSLYIYPWDKVEVHNNTLILVEGQFDCMLLRKWGYTNAISLMGGGISYEQSRIISGMCDKVIALFDNDEGGRKTLFRSKKLLQGVQFIPFTYPDISLGKDVGEWGKKVTDNVLLNSGKIHINRY